MRLMVQSENRLIVFYATLFNCLFSNKNYILTA